MYKRKKENSKTEDLKTYLKYTVLKESKKLKFKYPPISELVNGNQKIMNIKKISNLGTQNKDLFLIEVKNYSKDPKNRYFLAILLANQSSDFLVILAKTNTNFNKKFKLIQFPIYPQFHRIGLLCLIEINANDQISSSFQILKDFKKAFREKLKNLKNI